ncbi:MAG: cytochrome b/b6 domain-containing protein [Alphaproteobacteria bacterium]|nr:cytochrome b/b6 domain-containing protein [Alphaproteobacteria bacterium]MBV9692568.1 cytochrome b/b6 domain-containing protein [Alphaproteobacteria bacterium]
MPAGDQTVSRTRIPSRLRKALGLAPEGPHYLFYRHGWIVRLTHWANAAILFVMLLSGLQIFNAHPALYWGRSSDFDHPILSLTARGTDDAVAKGVTQIGPWDFDTTGVLGASKVDGQMTARGFPDWATIPGPQWLAMGRLWHFAFAWLFVANGLMFLVWATWRGHVRRDLLPTKDDIRHLPQEIVDHARLKFPKGEAAKRYNGLQKLAYSAVLFVVAPLIVATGLAMSPTMDAAAPWLPWIFGGRQSARTIHFLCAFSFLAFFIVHIVMVVLSGTWNNLRSMITGRYAIEGERAP